MKSKRAFHVIVKQEQPFVICKQFRWFTQNRGLS